MLNRECLKLDCSVFALDGGKLTIQRRTGTSAYDDLRVRETTFYIFHNKGISDVGTTMVCRIGVI